MQGYDVLDSLKQKALHNNATKPNTAPLLAPRFHENQQKFE